MKFRSLLCLSALALIASVTVGCDAQARFNGMQQSLCSSYFRSSKPGLHRSTAHRVKRDAPGTCPTVPTQKITDHFKTWLNANGYSQFDFSTNGCGRAGSFGGKLNDNDGLSGSKRPVIFVHGATDGVMGRGNTTGNARDCGWSQVLNYFMQQGYKMNELYALTWGANNPIRSSTLLYTTMYMERINKFIEAVLSYTGAGKVDIIGHSMGVPLSRGAIVGFGQVGPNLSSRVNTFIGIAGANSGQTMNMRVADNVFSICTPEDRIISMSSCTVPGQKCGLTMPGLTHLSVRSTTFQQQLGLIESGHC